MKIENSILCAVLNSQRQQLNTKHVTFWFFLVVVFILTFFSLAPQAVAQATSGNQTQAITIAPDSGQTKHLLNLAEIFTFFVLMLGPIKVLVPFVKMTGGTDTGFRRKLALRSTLISAIGALTAAFTGKTILKSWHISISALMLTMGILLFLVALQMVMQMYSHTSQNEGTSCTPSLAMAVSPLSFPIIVTPHGIAILIILMVTAQDTTRQIGIIGVLLAVMVMNLLTMLFAQNILKFIGTITLQILGSILGVLQVALGVEIVLRALITLGVIVSQGK
ncbi:MAG: MarC family protein [Candidatus Kuenenia sp.]|nr:MarC family protein [Candidatus Kuenenia hertensis]